LEEAGEDVEGDARAEGEKDGAARQEEKASYTGGQSTVAGREGACHGRHEDLCEGIRGENEADHEGGGVEGGMGRGKGIVEQSSAAVKNKMFALNNDKFSGS
jgi:hypothetical protein